MRHLIPILVLLACAAIPAPAPAQAEVEVTFDSSGFPHIALKANQPPGELMRPQVSPDLKSWRSLDPVAVGPDRVLRFSDFGGLGKQSRFYRAVALTPAGSYIVYERRAPDGSHAIMRCRFDGSDEKCLTVGHYPRVSRDGRWVIFTRDGTGPSFHTGASIYVIDLNDREPPQACGYFDRQIFNNTSGEELINFTWERDNIHFVFDCGGQLYRMTADGGGRRPFFPNSDCVEAMPSFGPDDGTLVFAHRLPTQVTTRRLGDVKRPLTPAGLGDSWPQWSPDGTKIVVCDGNTDFSRTDLGHNLVLVNPITGARSPLTQLTELGDGFPNGGTWSPDSLWIYAAGTVGGIQGMWRIPADGGDPQAVTIDSVFDISPGISIAPVAFVGGVMR